MGGFPEKGAFLEVEGELHYLEFQPKGSDARVRTAEIHATSILTLDRAEKTEQSDERAKLRSWRTTTIRRFEHL
jgi:hypothetical protein